MGAYPGHYGIYFKFEISGCFDPCAGMYIRGVPRGVLRVLEHPHQEASCLIRLLLVTTAAREEATHTVADLQLFNR